MGIFGWFLYRVFLRFQLDSEKLKSFRPKISHIFASIWVQSVSMCVQVGLHTGAMASTSRPVRMHALWRWEGRRESQRTLVTQMVWLIPRRLRPYRFGSERRRGCA